MKTEAGITKNRAVSARFSFFGGKCVIFVKKMQKLSTRTPLIITLMFCALPLFAQVAPASRTDIYDGKLAQKLVGVHKFALDWISGKDLREAGSMTIFVEDSLYKVKGVQKIVSKTRGLTRDENQPEYVTIAGSIRSIYKDMIIIDGTIVTRVGKVNNGAPCTRSGIFTFKPSPNYRDVYLMQETQNPCAGVTDRIYIYITTAGK